MPVILYGSWKIHKFKGSNFGHTVSRRWEGRFHFYVGPVRSHFCNSIGLVQLRKDRKDTAELVFRFHCADLCYGYLIPFPERNLQGDFFAFGSFSVSLTGVITLSASFFGELLSSFGFWPGVTASFTSALEVSLLNDFGSSGVDSEVAVLLLQRSGRWTKKEQFPHKLSCERQFSNFE